MQSEFFTILPVTIKIPIFQPLYALVALGVVIFVVAWVAVRMPSVWAWVKNRVISLWPKQDADDLDENRNKLYAKRIAYLMAPFVVFFVVLSLWRISVLLINPPDTPSLFGGGVDFRLHYLAFAGLATFFIALSSLPFALFRYEALERQTLAQEEGLTTDRINKAVEGLGAEKTRKKSATSSDGESRSLEETLPNLEVRIGSIYALERIAQDSLRDHIQIMEILCAYIRQNAPASEAPDLPKSSAWFGGVDPLSDDTWKARFEAWEEEHREALNKIKPRADIQTALTVIGRRGDRQKEREWGSKERYAQFQKGPPECPAFKANEDGAPSQGWRDAVERWKQDFGQWKELTPAYRLDLRETNLRKADMSGQSQKADFSHARFERVDLQGADFSNAQAQGADFRRAQAQGADFSFAQAQGADFSFAQAQGAVFWGAQAQGADFSFAQAQGAVFSDAEVQGAVFWGAQAQGADFSFAQAQGAVFSFAQAQGVDFRGTSFDENTNFRATEFLSVALKGDISSVALKSDISMLSLTQEQVNAAFGDGFTAQHLPDGLTKPDHWPDWEIGDHEFDEEWKKWQREGTAYKPPPKPVE